MTVESASYISQLDAALPAAGDQKSEGDDHFRLIKSVLKTQFPNFGTTAITTTAAEVNYLSGVTSAIQTQINSKAALASPALTGVPTAPTAAPGTNTTQLATTAFVAAVLPVDSATVAAASKATPVDADLVPLIDSAASNVLKKLTWANLKATLATWIGGGTIAGSFTTLAASGNTTLGDASTDTLNVGNGGIVKDASGNVGIGAAPGGDSSFRLSTNLTGATTAYGFRNLQTVQSGVTNNAFAYMSTPSTAAAAFTLLNLIHFGAYQGAIGAGSSITNQVGFFVDSSLTGATVNYGFYSIIAASGATRYNFYAAGDAPNRFAGETLVIGPAGLGYGTGAGGTVTQATSKSTAVTLNKPTGNVTTHNAALAAGASISFTINNTLVALSDTVVLSFVATLASVQANYSMTHSIGTSTIVITLKNESGGSLSEAVPINFCVVKGSFT